MTPLELSIAMGRQATPFLSFDKWGISLDARPVGTWPALTPNQAVSNTATEASAGAPPPSGATRARHPEERP